MSLGKLMHEPRRRPRRRWVEHYPLLKSVALIAGNGRLLARAAELARAAVTEFFLPQYETRLFPGIRPVLTLSHPLDERMPFRPHLLRFYLGYLQLVLRTMGFIHAACGAASRPDIARMFRQLVRLYYLCGGIYRRCQSTTAHRLPLRADIYTLVIRLFDPHLHCVPSLHILAMCYNYHVGTGILRSRLPPDHPALSRTGELFDIAVRIAETVLMVKQHSVMDIAPSLFLLSSVLPDFDESEVRRFAGALFRRRPELAAPLQALVLRGYGELQQAQHRAGMPDASTRIVEYLTRHEAGAQGCR